MNSLLNILVNNGTQEDLLYPHSTVQELLWDGLHYFGESVFKYWPFKQLREKALKRTIELIRSSAQESRYITTRAIEEVN